MTIGDVIGIISIVATTVATLVAAIVLTALLVPAKVETAASLIEDTPGRTIGVGAGALVFELIIAFVMHSARTPPIKIALGAELAVALVCALVGSAGLCRLVGRRIDAMTENPAPHAALTRAALLSVAAGILPVVGWVVIFPLQLMLSLGAGVISLWPIRRPVLVPAMALHAPVDQPAWAQTGPADR